MSNPDYVHLMLALCFLCGAVRYTFTQRLFGHAPRWPFLWGGYPMSPFSRWLQFSIYTGVALWEIACSLLHRRPSLLVAAIAILSMFSLGAAYRRDRHLARTNVA